LDVGMADFIVHSWNELDASNVTNNLQNFGSRPGAWLD
jgi:hypothetical protein